MALTRRRFLTSVCAALASFAPSAKLFARGDDPPNFLLIMADDLGAKELRCYGNREHRTPHLDRLAATGVMFKTCWATPMCSPTRAEIMTGRYGFRTGWYHNNMKFPVGAAGIHLGKSQLIFAELLKGAGYATAVSGKWQLPGKLPTLCHDFGFDEYCIWAQVNQLPPGARYDGPVDIVPGNTSRYWHPCVLRNGKHVSTTDADYGPDIFCAFVIDFMRRMRDRPFLAYYPMCLTHGPHDPTPDPEHRGGKTAGGFAACVEYMDVIVGRLVAALDDLGLREKTVLMFTADNGTAGSGKTQPTELGARVPLIVNCPGRVRALGPSEALVDLSDVLPTLAELSGAKIPEGYTIDGKSFAPVLRGEARSVRKWIFSYIAQYRMLRDERWLLERNTIHQFGRLYDCGDSRDGTGYREVTDSADPEVAATRERFLQILAGLPAPDPNDPKVKRALERIAAQKRRRQAISRAKRANRQ